MMTLRTRKHRLIGLTLIELVLVVAIISIVMTATVPLMVRSIRGNRLRTAGRTVVSSARYARSMAVMRQVDVHLKFHVGENRIEVSGAPARRSLPADTGKDEDDTASVEELVARAEEEDAADRPTARAATAIELSETLTKVSIASVEIDETDSVKEGTSTVVFYRNGRCVPFSVTLVDTSGDEMLITVDRFGTAASEVLE